MSCFPLRHVWSRSSDTADVPQIKPYQRCDCGMWTWGEMQRQGDKLAVILPWLKKHGGHERPCDCADPCSCGWSEVKKVLEETT